MTPVRALIFDFDGLLVDTETPAYQSWVEIFREHGAELPRALYQQDIGTAGMFDAIGELQRLTGKQFEHEVVWQARQLHKERLSFNQPLLPGVTELLQAAQQTGLPMAVASSSGSEWVESWLERLAIRQFFQCVRTRHDVERIKPAPDLFLAAAACLGVEPATCVVFEDSPHGMTAAAAAGMRCVAVPNDLTIDMPRPATALTLASLAELPLVELIERLEGASTGLP